MSINNILKAQSELANAQRENSNELAKCFKGIRVAKNPLLGPNEIVITCGSDLYGVIKGSGGAGKDLLNMAIVLLETQFTLKMTEEELRSSLKGIQCLELYEDQTPERKLSELLDNEIQVLRNFRSQLDHLAGDKE